MNAIAKQQPPARIIECTEAEYHKDPCETPSLSKSIAKVLVTESPLHAWAAHPKFGGEANENDEGDDDTDALKDGKIIHKLLLGKGATVEVIHADNFRTKIAQQQRDAAKIEGRVPMLARKYDDLVSAAETIKGNLLTEFGIDLDDPEGESEVAIEWTEDGAHGPVVCRCRMDRVHIKRGLILDVKKIFSAHPDVCGRQAVEYGHDIQDAAYRRALERLRPELAGRTEMIFLNVEVTPPFAMYPGPLDGELRELGRRRWDRAIFLWEECLRTGRWPAYTNRITPIRGAGYAVNRWMEQSESW